MKTKIYNIQGKETGSFDLPESIFGLPWSADLIHQVVTTMQNNARINVAHTKGRGEVRGGGRKPWQQKGTGRARHGSSRSPIWKGGGVTHGPRNTKVFGGKINKAMRQKALLVALSRKARDGQLVLVDSLAFEAPKTAAAKAALVALGKQFDGLNRRHNAALVALAAGNRATEKSFANMGHVEVERVANLNPVDVLSKKFLVLVGPDAAVEILSKKVNKK